MAFSAFNPKSFWNWYDAPYDGCGQCKHTPGGLCLDCKDQLASGWPTLTKDEHAGLYSLCGKNFTNIDRAVHIAKLEAKYFGTGMLQAPAINPAAAMVASTGPKYACAKVGAPGGCKCYKCGELNEYAGNNCDKGYVCYRCR